MNGFLGIKFGTSSANVKQAMSKKSESIYDSKNSNNSKLKYNGVKVGGNETLFATFYFYKDQLMGVTSVFSPNLEARIFDLYNRIKLDINSKYYVTKQDYKSFKYPYENGDGHETTAIKLGKADILSVWNFLQPDGSKNQIILSITEKLKVELFYDCGRISDEYDKKAEKQVAKDY
jgi:hypothetical protein